MNVLIFSISTVLLSLIYFVMGAYVSAANCPFPYIEFEDPPSPIIRKCKGQNDQNPVGHPDKMTPEYFMSLGLEFNQDVLDEKIIMNSYHRALHRQIGQLAMKGIGFYDDLVIPEDALDSYALEIFANEFAAYFSEILIKESVEEESKYLQAVVDLISLK